ncbi:tyrosine-type recombinase/integrase [Rubneribacter badeniensis]
MPAPPCRIPPPRPTAGRYAEGLTVPHVTIENMRHSFATSYLHAGGGVEDLSRILGHSDINTTYRRYVRPNVEDLRRGMDAVL